jgi:inorganic triphosphatase YgiF
VAPPLETEIKLACSPTMLERLRDHPLLAGDERTQILTTTHFDTPDARLSRSGATLRIRDNGSGREQTLKLASLQGFAGRRCEWNSPVSGDLPDLTALPAEARYTLINLLGHEPLAPVATAVINRTTRHLHSGHSTVEIAFDVGQLMAGGREEAVCELELELIEGELADVIALALKLPLGSDLRWSVRSKAERCRMLAHNLPPVAVQTQPVPLSPAMDVARACQCVAWNCLGQLLANYPLVITAADPEGVHQTRVAIRRLRAALTLFADVTSDEIGTVLRAELKAVALALGPARDLDVLVARVTAAAQAADDDLGEMLDHLVSQRGTALASAKALLAAEPFQRLLFQFAAWLEGGAWLSRTGETGADQPVMPFAAHILSRRRRKLRHVDKRLAHLSDADRHRLRINAKKLRYATSFFAALFTDDATATDRASFGTALRQLQDSLGELNDLAVAAASKDELFADLDPITAARQAARLGMLLAAQEESRRRLFEIAHGSLHVIANTPAWWKARKT